MQGFVLHRVKYIAGKVYRVIYVSTRLARLARLENPRQDGGLTLAPCQFYSNFKVRYGKVASLSAIGMYNRYVQDLRDCDWLKLGTASYHA